MPTDTDVTVPVKSAVQLELEALRAENEKLKAKATERANRAFTYKVSEKGALSIYGMGKWPLTIYVQNWDKLMAQLDTAKAFVEANRSKFSSKPPTE